MPKRKYVRDSKGRFAETSSGRKTKGRKPIGKSQTPLVEVYPGGPRASRNLQKKLKSQGAGDKLIHSMNYHSGGWTPRGAVGTRNLVAVDPKTFKAVGVAVVDVTGRPARGYGRSVSVGQLFKEKGAPRGTGTSLMAAAAKIAKSSDLGKGKQRTDLAVYGALNTAKGFYRKTGGRPNPDPNSGYVSYSTRARNKLANKRVRLVNKTGKRVK